MTAPKSLIINTPYICPQQYWEQACDGTLKLAAERRSAVAAIDADEVFARLKAKYKFK